jgi:hypothetical protein
MVWVNKTRLTPSHFIEVPVPSPESERSCIDVLRVSNLSYSTILIFDFPTVWYFVVSHFSTCIKGHCSETI